MGLDSPFEALVLLAYCARDVWADTARLEQFRLGKLAFTSKTGHTKAVVLLFLAAY
jgi:hypothetical protein